MAKKKKAVAAPKKVAKKKAPVVVARNLGAEIDEIKGDLARLVSLIGGQLGEPFRSLANEIVAKQQGAAPVEPKL